MTGGKQTQKFFLDAFVKYRDEVIGDRRHQDISIMAGSLDNYSAEEEFAFEQAFSFVSEKLSVLGKLLEQEINQSGFKIKVGRIQCSTEMIDKYVVPYAQLYMSKEQLELLINDHLNSKFLKDFAFNNSDDELCFKGSERDVLLDPETIRADTYNR